MELTPEGEELGERNTHVTLTLLRARQIHYDFPRSGFIEWALTFPYRAAGGAVNNCLGVLEKEATTS